MKINNGYQDSRAASAQEAAKTQEAAAVHTRAAKAGSGVGRSGGTDEVSLSSLASALQGALSESPDRAAYLDQLAGEYAAGTYKPNVEGTVKGILNEAALNPLDPNKE